MFERERERGRRFTLLIEEARERFDGVEGLSGIQSDASEPPECHSNNGTSRCCDVGDRPLDVGYCEISVWTGRCCRTRAGSNTRSTIRRGRVRGRPLETVETEALRKRGLKFEVEGFPYEGRSRDCEKGELDVDDPPSLLKRLRGVAGGMGIGETGG